MAFGRDKIPQSPGGLSGSGHCGLRPSGPDPLRQDMSLRPVKQNPPAEAPRYACASAQTRRILLDWSPAQVGIVRWRLVTPFSVIEWVPYRPLEYESGPEFQSYLTFQGAWALKPEAAAYRPGQGPPSVIFSSGCNFDVDDQNARLARSNHINAPGQEATLLASSDGAPVPEK